MSRWAAAADGGWRLPKQALPLMGWRHGPALQQQLLQLLLPACMRTSILASPAQLPAPQVVKSADVIFIAVKPQYVSVVLREVRTARVEGLPVFLTQCLQAYFAACQAVARCVHATL